MIANEKNEMKRQLSKKDSDKIAQNNSNAGSLHKEKSSLEEKKKTLDEQLKALLGELSVVSKKKGSMEGTFKSKTTDLKKHEEKVDELNKEIEKARKESFDIEVFAKQWEKQKAFHEKKLSELRSEKGALELELKVIEEKKAKIGSLSNGKSLEAGLKGAEKEFEQLEEKKNRAVAQKENEERLIAELKKALAKCPVCETKLEEERKKKLVEQKNALIAEHRKNEERHEKELLAVKVKITEAKEKLLMVAKLSAEISHEKNILGRISEVSKKISAVLEELDQKAFEVQLKKRNLLAEAIKTLINRREESKNLLGAMRAQNIFEEFSNITRVADELQQKKSTIDSGMGKIAGALAEVSLRLGSIEKENSELQKEIDSAGKEIEQHRSLNADLESEVLEKEKEIEKAKAKNLEMTAEKDRAEKKVERLEKELITEAAKIKKIELRLNEFAIEKSRVEVRKNDLKEEAVQFAGVELIGSKGLDELNERLGSVEKRLAQIGIVNMKAMDNFNELKKEVDDIQQKAEKLGNERLAVLDMIDKIDVRRTEVFTKCFNEINKNFQEMFFKFFNGEGNLEFSDPQKPLDSGLIISAKHKGNKMLSIDAMSGGEKTLTALAFMFAIQLYSPAPFYAFDEADAALDKENSFKMSNLIEKIAEKSQFVAITHNDVITKKADQIIGVARSKDNSSVIGLKLKNRNEEEKEGKAAEQAQEAS